MSARTENPTATFANISAQAVRRATGRTWEMWLADLDRAGCASKSHPEIARIAGARFGASPWWAQAVTVGYEQARGLRRAHQKPDGFSASVSRTFDVPAARLTEAFASPTFRARWLGNVPMELRTVHPGRSVRLWWRGTGRGNGTSVVTATVTAKGPSRSSVQVGHDRLRTAACVGKSKRFWAAALERLRETLAA